MNPFFFQAACMPCSSALRILQPTKLIRLVGLFGLVGTLIMPVKAFGPTRFRPGETQTGLASWYGAGQGRHTASGERFNPQALTAAHRRLPFGTIIRVTNTLNGRSVELRINDRGPWVHGRILDVTDAAADVLQMKQQGTVPVLLEVLALGPPSKHAHG